ncbi:MAG: M4 family metallopeptidase [Gammaproteobacteria bacterium]|nr:M4 family metallopeptidase [Gammaproteobacteria bacterium]
MRVFVVACAVFACLGSFSANANQAVAHIFDYQAFCERVNNKVTHDGFNRYLLDLSAERIDGDVVVYPNRIEGNRGPGVAQSAQLAQSYDQFRRLMGINGVDGQGKRHNLVVNAGLESEPFGCALSDEFQGFSVSGGGYSFDAFTPITLSMEEVVGHEAYHAFISGNANLEYEFQSGALNEALSDAFGVVFRMWLASGKPNDGNQIRVVDDAHWQLRYINEPLRDFESPNNVRLSPQPDHMNQYRKMPLADDAGGVHINSGIINHGFYLLSEGGQHRRTRQGPNVSGIGPYKALQIWHGGLLMMNPHSDFRDARDKFQRAAVAIFGHGSAEVQAVVDALDAIALPAVALPPAPNNPVPNNPAPSNPLPEETEVEVEAPSSPVPTTPSPTTPSPTSPAPGSQPGPSTQPPTSAEPPVTPAESSNRWLLIAVCAFLGLILIVVARRQPFEDEPLVATVGLSEAAAEPSFNRTDSAAKASVVKPFKLHIDGQKFFLSKERLTSRDGEVFGRSANFSHVMIAAKGASRRHLRFSYHSNRLYVTDLNSSSGTQLNGVALAPMTPTPVVVGDVITIADSTVIEVKYVI